jgi:uncharacterized protein
MTVTGKIKNVVDFGAFVDLGIKESALVHISELSDHFVKNPMDLIKVGDVLEFRIIDLDRDRRRIGLSRKSGNAAPAAAENNAPKDSAPKKPIPEGNRGSSLRSFQAQRQVSPKPKKDDDGTMYNPFAEALKKMREK